MASMSTELSEGFMLGSSKVEPLRGAVTSPDERIHHLEPKVMMVFVCLAERANEMTSRHDLLDIVWNGNKSADEQLTRAIGELRRVFRNGHGEFVRIETVPKRGYRLIGEVSLLDGPNKAPSKSDRNRENRRLLLGVAISVVAVSVAVVVKYLDTIQPVVTNYRPISSSQVIMPPVSSPFAIVVDDSSLYFNEFIDGEITPRQLARSGGESKPLKLSIVDEHSIAVIDDIAQDHSTFLVTNYNGAKAGKDALELWLVPIAGGRPTRFGSGYAAKFSPSGDKILFMEDSVNMFIVNSDMTGKRKLATLQNKVYWIRFSPDGTRVRFTQFHNLFASNLWEMKLDGSEPYRLFDGWGAKSLCCGSWTPAGKFYVFEARVGGDTQLWAVENSNDGEIGFAEPFKITSGVIDFLRPTIADDGKTIFATGWQLRGEIFEYDYSNGSYIPVPGLESKSVDQVAISRDGKSMAYVSYPEGILWSKDIDKDYSVQLTSEPMLVAAPVWSPSGDNVAFSGWVPEGVNKIYVVPANGGELRLISVSDDNCWSPSWSNDGGKLVFSDAGRDQLQIYDFARNEVKDMSGTEGIRSPSWSPDGKSIVAWRGKNLVQIDVENQELTVLLENAKYRSNFKYWSEDSNQIYLVESFLAGSSRSVFRLSIDDRKLSRIAEIGKIKNAWGTNGRWVGIRPDEKILLLRDQSIHNIYALEWDPH